MPRNWRNRIITRCSSNVNATISSDKNSTVTRRHKHSTRRTVLPFGLIQPKEQPRLLQKLSRFYLLPFPRNKLGDLRPWTRHVSALYGTCSSLPCSFQPAWAILIQSTPSNPISLIQSWHYPFISAYVLWLIFHFPVPQPKSCIRLLSPLYVPVRLLYDINPLLALT
jgi:hypothetical protein